MHQFLLLVVLLLSSAVAWAEFSCLEGTEATCIEAGDKVCAASHKCVDESTTCFDDFPCTADEGFVCGAEYDAALNSHKRSTQQYDELVAENVDLRQQRLDRKNCVLNATNLTDAQRCVR